MTTTIYLDTTATPGGDGSLSTPYASVAEMLAGENPTGVVEVYQLSDIFGDVRIPWDCDELYWRRNPNGTRHIIRPVLRIDSWELHTSAGTAANIYRQPAGDYPDPVPYFVKNWETEDASGYKGRAAQGVNGTGGSGFMPVGTNLTAMQEEPNTWFQQGSGRLFVALPKGDTAEKTETPDECTFYAAEVTDQNADGHAFRITGDIGIIDLDIDAGLCTKDDSTQEGNILYVTGSFDVLRLRNPNLQGGYYHNFVTVVNSHGRIEIIGNDGIVATAFGRNDGLLTCYATSVWADRSVIDKLTIGPFPYTYLGGTPVIDGTIKVFGTHDGASSTTMPGKTLVYQNNTIDVPDDNEEHVSFVLTANNINHAVPTDIEDPDQYSVHIVDNLIRGIMRVGGGSGSTVSAYIARNLFLIDLSDVTAFDSDPAALAFKTGGASDENHCLFEHNIIIATLPDIVNASIIGSWGAGENHMLFRHNSVYLAGSYTTNVGLLYIPSTTGTGTPEDVRFERNIFDAENDVYLIRNSGNFNTLAAVEQNWYSSRLNSTAQQSSGKDILDDSGGGDVQNEWEQPGEGVFEVAPVYEDADLLTLSPEQRKQYKFPDETMRRRGYGGGAYDGTLGAHQYGSTRSPRSRERVRHRESVLRGSP